MSYLQNSIVSVKLEYKMKEVTNDSYKEDNLGFLLW